MSVQLFFSILNNVCEYCLCMIFVLLLLCDVFLVVFHFALMSSLDLKHQDLGLTKIQVTNNFTAVKLRFK